jgi:CRISPR/Cas system CMR-associated protein Cmr5 small subunit
MIISINQNTLITSYLSRGWVSTSGNGARFYSVMSRGAPVIYYMHIFVILSFLFFIFPIISYASSSSLQNTIENPVFRHKIINPKNNDLNPNKVYYNENYEISYGEHKFTVSIEYTALRINNGIKNTLSMYSSKYENINLLNPENMDKANEIAGVLKKIHDDSTLTNINEIHYEIILFLHSSLTTGTVDVNRMKKLSRFWKNYKGIILSKKLLMLMHGCMRQPIWE